MLFSGFLGAAVGLYRATAHCWQQLPRLPRHGVPYTALPQDTATALPHYRGIPIPQLPRACGILPRWP